MAKKTSRSRRDRQRLSSAQMQAYRARQAAVAPRTEEPTASVHRPATPAPRVSAWGRLDEEYALIRADLLRLTVITVLMFGVIAVLWVVLG